LVQAKAEPQPLAQDATYEGFDVRKAVGEHLLDGFRHFYLDPDMLGLPPEVEHASVIALEEVVSTEVKSARRAGRELVIDVVVECEVRVETYAWQEVPDDDVALPMSEEDYLDDVAPRVLLRVEVSMTVDPALGAVTAVQVRDVSPVR
jgi:hypothetical protein